MTVDGGCHELTISTDLPLTLDSGAPATAICDIAATEGYAKDISSISVVSTDGHTEVAVGQKGTDCFAPPR